MAELKYSHLLFTGLRDDMPGVLDYMASPAAYFRGAHQIPGANINMGWQVIVKPTFMEKAPHTHDCDEYFALMGAQLPPSCGQSWGRGSRPFAASSVLVPFSPSCAWAMTPRRLAMRA